MPVYDPRLPLSGMIRRCVIRVPPNDRAVVRLRPLRVRHARSNPACVPSHQGPARRQSRRNRHSRHARRGRAGHPHGVDLFPGGPLLPAPHEGGPELPGRRRQGPGRGLPGHRRHHPDRESRAGRCNPSGLRLPVGEPRVRRSLRRRRHPLRRADAGDHASPGQQDHGAQSRRVGGRAGDAGDAAAAARRCRDRAARPRSRLPGDAEGELGRRRSRHAHRRTGKRAQGNGRDRAARGQGGLRQRRGVSRKAGAPRASHRGAAAGRLARQPRAPVRARLHGATSQPESDRTRARHVLHRRAAHGAVRRGAEDRARGALSQRRYRRIPAGRRHGEVLFHRGQSAGPGGTHRHRSRHRHRHRARPDPDRRRRGHRRSRQRRAGAAGHPPQRLRHAMPRDDGRSGKQFHSGLRPHHRLSQSRRLRHPSRCRHGVFRSDHHALLRLAAGESDGVVADAAGNHRPHASRAVGIPRARRGHQPALPRPAHHASAVRVGGVHDQVHRSDARAVPLSAQARSRDPPAEFHRRRHRQRQSGSEGTRPSGAPHQPEGAAGRVARAGRRHEAASGCAGPGEIRRVDAGAEVRAAHGYDHARCAPVTAGDALPYPRSRGHRAALLEPAAESVFGRMLGRRDLRCVDALPQRVPVGTPAGAARSDAEPAAADAAALGECRRLHQLSRQCRAVLRQTGGDLGCRPVPRLRFPELGAEHARRHRRSSRCRQAVRSRDLLHRQPVRSRTDQVRPQVLPRARARTEGGRRAHSRHQGHGRPVPAAGRVHAGQGIEGRDRPAGSLPHA